MFQFLNFTFCPKQVGFSRACRTWKSRWYCFVPISSTCSSKIHSQLVFSFWDLAASSLFLKSKNVIVDSIPKICQQKPCFSLFISAVNNAAYVISNYFKKASFALKVARGQPTYVNFSTFNAHERPCSHCVALRYDITSSGLPSNYHTPLTY